MQVQVPGRWGVCPPARGDVAGDKLQLCPRRGQVSAVLHPSPVQQLLPAGRPGTAPLSP